MSHTPPITLNKKTKTVAYYSIARPKNLVIFVHGFIGKATGSWDEFPEIIHNSGVFKESDVIFYGYDSILKQANTSAVKFKQFLLQNTLNNTPERNKQTGTRLGDDFEYQNILLVAHSLGAIVVRRALLLINSGVTNHPVLSKTKMILFAPAHRGTLVRDSYLTALPGIMKVLGPLGLLAVPVIKNLQPDSGTITDLRNHTSDLLKQGGGQFTIARKVIWAEYEHVVLQDFFDLNEIPEIPKGTNHISVCKPRLSNYREPLLFVTNELV